MAIVCGTCGREAVPGDGYHEINPNGDLVNCFFFEAMEDEQTRSAQAETDARYDDYIRRRDHEYEESLADNGMAICDHDWESDGEGVWMCRKCGKVENSLADALHLKPQSPEIIEAIRGEDDWDYTQGPKPAQVGHLIAALEAEGDDVPEPASAFNDYPAWQRALREVCKKRRE